MSDSYVTMTRDEYMEKYGKDPDELVAPQDSGGGVKDHLKSLAVGVATTPTDIIALPGLAYSGASALYRSYANDTKFMDEFQKNIQVEDAQKNITGHLQEVEAAWRANNPNMDDDTIKKGLEDYKKSKQYEDFTTEQLSGSAYLAAKAKDTVRKLLGDERPSSERGWSESAAEVIGGALVPGPAGWAGRVGSAAAKAGKVADVAVNNPLSRGALKTAEVLTPLTMPYSGTNVAINAGVGVGVDQAIRYAEGKSTAFTPTPTDSAGVGALAATGAGIAGLAAFVGVVKGRSREVLSAAEAARTSTARALEDAGSTNIRTSAEPKVGEPLIVAGREQELHATPSIAEKPYHQAAAQKGITQYVDESYASLAEIRKTHGPDEANWMEALRSDSGSVLHDTAAAEAEAATRELFSSIDALPNADMRGALDGMVHSTLTARNKEIERLLADKVANLEKSLKDPTASTELTQAKSDLARLRADDPSARAALPDIPNAEKEALAHAFENDLSPEMQRVREALKKWGDDMLGIRVSSGRESPSAATKMRSQDPYYVPIANDPLKGLKGTQRIWRSTMNSVDNAMTRDAEGAASAMARESPIHEFKKEVPSVKDVGDPETRITAVMDPRTSIARYTQHIYREAALTKSRNEGVRLLTTKPDGTPSDLVRNGRIRELRDPNTNKSWIENTQLDTPFVTKAMANPHVVPVWENGRVKFWEFGDREHAAWLRQDPVRFNGMMKTLGATSRWFKFFTTGRGNPIFTLKGAAYDLLIGILTRMPNRSFGTASYLANRYLPEGFARNVVGRLPDPTAFVTVPYHAVMSIAEMLAHYGTRKVADGLSQMGPFAAFRQVVGEKNFHAMVNASLKVATMAENFATIKMQRFGAARGVRDIDNVATVRGHYEAVKDTIPAPIKGAWRFYTDVLDSVYLAPKRMFYTENYALLHQKWGGNIPEKEMIKLQHETRAIGGDMTKVPASKGMKDMEHAMPYLTQTKLGAWHLMRHMGSPETAGYMLPRLALMTYAVGQSIYWRTYWNEDSRKDYWEKTPEYDRWRGFDVPSPRLLLAWARGENPNFDRKLIYRITLPPDITGIIASATAMMQMMGMIPANATPKPIAQDLPKIWLDSLTPAMPPLLQALLAQSGMKLDVQGADTRGGQWIRNYNSTFKAGPQAESFSNLGQLSNSTALTLNSLFGAMGSYLASGTDVAMHASKFNMVPGQRITAKQSTDFAAGLRAGTTEIYNKGTANVPDVPLIWQNPEKYKVSTPAWQYVKENTQHIRSISGMRDDVLGKAAQQRQQQAQQVGGATPQVLNDLALIKIAQDVKAWQNPTGELGKLRKEYNVLSGQNRAVASQYNLPQEERTKRTNVIIGRMQQNMQQQHLATKYLEQTIADKYGQVLAPKLQGRRVSLKTLDEMLRENISGSSSSSAVAEEH